jgi:RHS repeat-associated protein
LSNCSVNINSLRNWFISDYTDIYAYRFSFQGQEKDDEILGNGNSYTAEYWQYDPRLGRRWNLDPVVKEWESPYACFNNSPIIVIDPNGQTGVVTKFNNGCTYQGVKYEGNVLFVEANIYLYGDDATPAYAKSIESTLNDQLNNVTTLSVNGESFSIPDHASTVIEGVSYKVIFKVNVEYASITVKEIQSNTDHKNNYVRVGTQSWIGSSFFQRTSHYDKGSNSGYFDIPTMKPSTATHEFLESLGSPIHNDTRDEYQSSPDYREAEFIPYRIPSSYKLIPDNAVFRLMEEDLKTFVNDINWDASGNKGTIGTLSNLYLDEKGIKE